MNFLSIRIETSVKRRILYPLVSPFGTTIKTVHTHPQLAQQIDSYVVESSIYCFELPRAILIQDRSNIVTC